jgi:hypothetical protein
VAAGIAHVELGEGLEQPAPLVWSQTVSLIGHGKLEQRHPRHFTHTIHRERYVLAVRKGDGI